MHHPVKTAEETNFFSFFFSPVGLRHWVCQGWKVQSFKTCLSGLPCSISDRLGAVSEPLSFKGVKKNSFTLELG